MALVDDISVVLGLCSLGGVALAAWRWGVPRWRTRRAVERAKNEVILGRPAVPANPITGEEERPAIPGLGDRLATMDAKQEYLIAKQHESQQQQRQLDRIEQRLADGDTRMDRIEANQIATADELHEVKSSLADTLHNAAEASKHALSTIDAAIHATPPEPLPGERPDFD